MMTCHSFPPSTPVKSYLSSLYYHVIPSQLFGVFPVLPLFLDPSIFTSTICLADVLACLLTCPNHFSCQLHTFSNKLSVTLIHRPVGVATGQVSIEITSYDIYTSQHFVSDSHDMQTSAKFTCILFDVFRPSFSDKTVIRGIGRLAICFDSLTT